MKLPFKMDGGIRTFYDKEYFRKFVKINQHSEKINKNTLEMKPTKPRSQIE